MALSVEPSKPRLIYDARPLNKHVGDFPVSMDTVGREAQITAEMCCVMSIDDASAFHHIGVVAAPRCFVRGSGLFVARVALRVQRGAVGVSFPRLCESVVPSATGDTRVSGQLARHFAAKLTSGSTLAWGGVVFAGDEFRAGGVFPPERMPKHINFKEMYAFQFCETHPEVLRRAQVPIDMDNTAAVSAITVDEPRTGPPTTS